MTYMEHEPPTIEQIQSKQRTVTITPEAYMGKDIDLISDIIRDILEECHAISIESLSFDINVNYTEKDY